jgi:hypothetical protein
MPAATLLEAVEVLGVAGLADLLGRQEKCSSLWLSYAPTSPVKWVLPLEQVGHGTARCPMA